MSAPSTCRQACVILSAILSPTLAPAQGLGGVPRIHVAAGGGFLTSGDYFAGPGALAVANGDALAVAIQASLAVNRTLAVMVAVTHARPEAQLTGIPVIGSVAAPGGRLWFTDAAVRAQTPLGAAARAPRFFAQAGAGIVHYALVTTLLDTKVDEQATNLAVALGAGLELPVSPRLSIEALAKDYVVSFKSVRDLQQFGVEGRRAHTLVLLVSARVGL